MSTDQNRWQRIANTVAEKARAESDGLAEKIRGGTAPPFQSRLPRREQVRQFLLLARPPQTLLPVEAQEAEQIWQEQFAGQSRADLARWSSAMLQQIEGMVRRQAPMQDEEIPAQGEATGGVDDQT